PVVREARRVLRIVAEDAAHSPSRIEDVQPARCADEEGSVRIRGKGLDIVVAQRRPRRDIRLEEDEGSREGVPLVQSASLSADPEYASAVLVKRKNAVVGQTGRVGRLMEVAGEAALAR